MFVVFRYTLKYNSVHSYCMLAVSYESTRSSKLKTARASSSTSNGQDLFLLARSINVARGIRF
jgi:hypothetical protein